MTPVREWNGAIINIFPEWKYFNLYGNLSFWSLFIWCHQQNICFSPKYAVWNSITSIIKSASHKYAHAHKWQKLTNFNRPMNCLEFLKERCNSTRICCFGNTSTSPQEALIACCAVVFTEICSYQPSTSVFLIWRMMKITFDFVYRHIFSTIGKKIDFFSLYKVFF